MDILIPISICVILPVMIVWLAMRTAQNETNKRAEVMIKAIEAGAELDTDFFKAQQKQKSVKERLLGRLSGACVTAMLGIAMLLAGICLCNAMPYGWDLNKTPMPFFVLAGGVLLGIGIALFIVYFVGRKVLAAEIEAEEKALTQKK